MIKCPKLKNQCTVNYLPLLHNSPSPWKPFSTNPSQFLTCSSRDELLTTWGGLNIQINKCLRVDENFAFACAYGMVSGKRSVGWCFSAGIEIKNQPTELKFGFLPWPYPCSITNFRRVLKTARKFLRSKQWRPQQL